MKRSSTFLLLLSTVINVSHAQLAIRGETVYTMAGKPLKNAVVIVKGGKIEQVLEGAMVKLPEGYRVMEAKVVTPGLVDAHTVVGLTGILNQRHDQMQLETSEPIQPELRAIDAYNPQEQLIEFVRNLGVTTMHTGHAPGALASGTTIVVKTIGNTIEDALVDSGMVAFTFGESVSSTFKSPGTSAKQVAMLRSELLKAQDYLKRKSSKDPEKRPAPDLKMEMLSRILLKQTRILFTAQKATDIMSALRLKKEFGFAMVLDGAAEAYLVLDEIKKAGVPVILHPTMMRGWGDTRNVSFETAAKLKETGILFALQSGFEGYVPKTRIVLYEAAIAAANGLSFDDALASITINAAKIIGVDKRVGSIEKGKDADLVLFDGDPFEYTTHVCGVVVNGKVVNDTCK
ncbi:MAG: amidohydrolase family protein [Bacteroidetes bacterium]|nr:amidohydrolase family protein [Bacteroidota bacterium]MCW5894555.1 amidohydrolase family protein [Bacteroidota bacterium]